MILKKAYKNSIKPPGRRNREGWPPPSPPPTARRVHSARKQPVNIAILIYVPLQCTVKLFNMW